MTLKRKREEEQAVDNAEDKRIRKNSHADQRTESTLASSSKSKVESKSKRKLREGTQTNKDAKHASESVPHEGKPSKQKLQNKRTPNKIPFKPRPKIVKLAPHRPYPTVPTSSNATGPKSKWAEGSNKICVTRRTNLGAYLSQCKDVFIKGGTPTRGLKSLYRHKELFLTAMGAAIPHAVMLATSLPAILPFGPEEIQTSVKTGTARVMDEVIPMDEDDEGGMQTRHKATIEIVIRVTSDLPDPPAGDAATMSEDSFSD
ncbi:hypothetical protein CPB86DRAFT_822623 [Serendipita vermifera]|nr:hypothetical protein CPB86DRAFT_822623 [Serendipita vermifera]